jgi:hypothetical protein
MLQRIGSCVLGSFSSPFSFSSSRLDFSGFGFFFVIFVDFDCVPSFFCFRSEMGQCRTAKTQRDGNSRSLLCMSAGREYVGMSMSLSKRNVVAYTNVNPSIRVRLEVGRMKLLCSERYIVAQEKRSSEASFPR